MRPSDLRLRTSIVALCMGLAMVLDASPALAISVSEGRAFAVKSGNFLLSVQDKTVGSPTQGSLFPLGSGTYAPLALDNITGVTALGLVAAYRITNDPRYLTGARMAGDYLAPRQQTGNFASADPLFLIELSEVTGETKYRDAARIGFFDALEAGTYLRRGVTYNTAAYIALVRQIRSGANANIFPWDMAKLVVASVRIDHPAKTAFRNALQEGMDAIYAGKEVLLPGGSDYDWAQCRFYDTLAIAGGVDALASIGDPTPYVALGLNYPALVGKNLVGLADFLSQKTVTNNSVPERIGAFTYLTSGDYGVPGTDAIDDAQSTEYAMGALSFFGSRYQTTLDEAFAYLTRLQLASGEVQQYWDAGSLIGTGSDWAAIEITAEALTALATVNRVEVSPSATTTVVISNGSGATVEIPPGAVQQLTEITIAPAPTDAASGYLVQAGIAYELGPAGTVFLSPVTITLPFSPSALTALGKTVNDLVILQRDGATITRITPTHIDLDRKVVTFVTTHFSVFQPGVIVDTTPPVLTLPVDIVAEATSPGGAVVTYAAFALDAVDGAVPVVCTPASGAMFPLGKTTVPCTATDLAGNVASGTFAVTVRDTKPPTIQQVKTTPDSLWPPNHQMVTVTVTASATDLVDRAPVCKVTKITSSEPENGLGDGDTAPDWLILGGLTASLRAERAGGGSGRIYTLTVACSDASGNSATATTTVRVPKSQGK
jgi:hypothetical protein